MQYLVYNMTLEHLLRPRFEWHLDLFWVKTQVP